MPCHHQNSCIKISQNTKKSPGDMRRHENPSANSGEKNSKMNKIIITMIIIICQNNEKNLGD